ncbi:MAG: DUF6198 family protein [Clostridium sp.]|uniref:YczE/YyaS/YitT family protein n=1 Tax=Clostridium sp. TaxID=1506 RepID=UPI0029134A78|nr:DUF6198 family protein [Clostridium sp.]MDU5111286.1 DUF6198 family protein [Clostridium sp.]
MSLRRFIRYFLGMLILALGSVVAIKSGLGVSPITSLPFVINNVTNISIGTASAILYSSYVGMQFVILKRDFKKLQLLQIVFAILFGNIVNLFNRIISINFDNLVLNLLLLLLSFVFTALGVTLTINANLVPVAPDGLVQALSQKYKIPFGKIKIYFDFIVVMISCILMFFVKGGIEGIGIGTILSVFTVGKMISYFSREEIKVVRVRDEIC